VDGESEYANGGQEEDKLQSDMEAKVCIPSSDGSAVDKRSKTQANTESSFSPSKVAKMQQTAKRQQKKQKLKAEERKLQAKRQEMDKAKVSLAQSFLSSIFT
jgi:SWI/SNF-related matrix-associated actin-dependent regulator of chromatin subfamily A member 5